MSRPTATKATGTAIAIAEPAKNNPIDVFRQELTVRAPHFRPLLPAHVSFEKFSAVVIAAVSSKPNLLKGPRPALFKACRDAAELGLSLNPVLGEGDILEVWNNKLGAHEAQFRPRYGGLMKLARQSGEIKDIYSQVVREGDVFLWEEGLNKDLKHTPKGDGVGEITHAYVVWVLKDGTKGFEVVTRKRLDQIREKSEGFKAFKAGKIKSTTWVSDEAEMCRKAAVKVGSKYMPRSAEMGAFHNAVAMDNLRDAGREAEIVEGEIIADAEDITDTTATETGQPADRQMDDMERRMSQQTQQQPAPAIPVVTVPQVDGMPDWNGWADAAVAAIGKLPADHAARWAEVHKAVLGNCEFNAPDEAARVMKAVKEKR